MRGALLALGLGLTLLASTALAGEGHLHPVEVSLSTPDLRQGERAVVRMTLTIASGHWLHAREEVTAVPLRWEVGMAPAGISVGPVEVPAPTAERGERPVHVGTVVLKLPVTPADDAGLGRVTIPTTVGWQVCTPDGCRSAFSRDVPIDTRVLPPAKAPSK